MADSGTGAAASGGAIYGPGIFGAVVFFWQQASVPGVPGVRGPAVGPHGQRWLRAAGSLVMLGCGFSPTIGR